MSEDDTGPGYVQGQAGASARREHERRHEQRENRVLASHPKLGGLLLTLFGDPQTTTAWERGAVGEERLGRRLDAAAGPLVRVLHDRRIPRTRANIDHIVVCRSGVVVIDAKRYVGRPSLKVEGGVLRPRTETLLVGRRDYTKLVDGALKQVSLVQAAIASLHPDTQVSGMLCFVDADWPLFGGSFTTRGIEVTWQKATVARVQRPGPLGVTGIDALVATVGRAFPAA